MTNVIFAAVMFLVGIGFIVFGIKSNKKLNVSDDMYASRNQNRIQKDKRNNIIYIACGVLVILLSFVAISPFTIIKPGHVGVKVLFGKVDEKPLYEGFNLVNPLAEIVVFNTQVREYSMIARNDEGHNKGDDSSTVISQEGMQLTIDLTGYYRIIPEDAPVLFTKFGKDVLPVIRPVLRSSARDVFANYLAEEAYAKKRDEISKKLIERVQERVSHLTKQFGIRGVEISDILIRDVSPPQSIKEAIEKKQRADQEAQQMVFVLQKEKQEAERKRIEAQGIQDFQNIVSKGINKDLLTWKGIEATEKLAESQNSKIVIIGGGGGNGLPIILNTDK